MRVQSALVRLRGIGEQYIESLTSDIFRREIEDERPQTRTRRDGRLIRPAAPQRHEADDAPYEQKDGVTVTVWADGKQIGSKMRDGDRYLAYDLAGNLIGTFRDLGEASRAIPAPSESVRAA